MKNKSILLVEDNPDDVALMIRALKKNKISHSVTVVQDGAEALDYLFGQGDYAGRNTGIQPTLVLLDLNLPKIDGLDVLRRIRADERTKSLPVVVLTSSNNENDLAGAYAGGADKYVQKPVNYGEFVEVVRRIGQYWLGIGE